MQPFRETTQARQVAQAARRQDSPCLLPLAVPLQDVAAAKLRG